MPQRPLPPTLVAFNGGVPLYAGDDSPDLTKPFDVEIGLSGQYKTRNFSLDGKQFEQMIANHHAAGVDPAVDRGHESWFSFVGNEPAVGWVRGLRIEQASGDARRKALVASVELNDLGQHAVKNGHFRYVSMGFDKAGKNRMSGEPVGAVLDHLALVKNPFIQGMRPLSLALSSKLGRLVEEEPMEILAQKLRAALGLSADATEEQIIAAFEVQSSKLAAQAAVGADASTALAEQKRINERLEQGLKDLGADSERRKSAEWAGTVAAAVKDFRLTPAEATEHEKLTGAERDVASRLLALRTPNKPAGTKIETKDGAGGDRTERALALMAEYQKAHPEASSVDAYAACAAKSPELFAEEV